MRFALPLVALALLLGGCQLSPLYSGGDAGSVRASLASVEVAPIEGRTGWLMANALRDRMSSAGTMGTARYRLEVKLDDQITSLGVRRDDSVSRERRTLRARYQLVDLTDGQVVVDSTAGSDAGVDVVGSEYATLAAERSALDRLTETVADQIVARVALFTRSQAPAQPPPPAQ